jgi:muramoyltetrapeptide carboxypeptidase
MEPDATELRIPPRLFSGDTIGIAAPGSPFDLALFQKGVAVLVGMGFRVAFDDGLFQRCGYLAGPDAHRAALLNGLFADPAVKAIFCARGGYGTLRLIEHLQWAAICRSPKLLVGFSDVTNLHAALWSRCRLVSLHGPNVTGLALDDDSSRSALMAALTGEAPVALKLSEGVTLQAGAASGIVLGGNLTSLCHLIGTRFHPRFEGRLLFLEDRGEAPYRIDRMLTQMTQAGCLKGVAGVILGDFTACGSPQAVYEVFRERLGGRGIPILAGLQAGHEQRNLPLPLGLEAVLDADARTLRYRLPVVA